MIYDNKSLCFFFDLRVHRLDTALERDLLVILQERSKPVPQLVRFADVAQVQESNTAQETILYLSRVREKN